MHAIEEAPQDMFEAAMADFRAGHRAQSAQRCHDILAAHPAFADANHLLGVLLYQDGHPSEGEKHIRAALALRETVQAQCDLALTLKAQTRFAEAESALRRAIEIDPAFALAHFQLGRVLDQQGDQTGAEPFYRRALACNPNSAETLFQLGKTLSVTNRAREAREMLERAIALRPTADAFNSLAIVFDQLGMLAEAEAAFHRAADLNPNFAEVRCNLAARHMEAGRLDEAEAMLRSAIEANPRFAGGHVGLGKLYVRLSRFDEAIAEYQRAVELAPSDAGVHNALGGLLAEAGRFEEAEAPLRRAVELLPHFAGAHGNLGSFLLDNRRYNEAEAELRKAMELDPKLWMAPYNLSVMYRDTRRLDQSEAMARRVIELNPTLPAAYVALGNALLGKNCGDIAPALDSFRKALELDPQLHIAHANLAYSNTFDTDDGYAILEECKRFAARFETPYLPESVSFSNDFSPERRLRIGYVSPDFRDHCQAMFMMPLMQHHDHDAVEIYCYSSVGNPDHVTKRLAGYADVFRDVNRLSDDELAAQIREDRIDILVDLTMHMAKGRPLLARRRPAPVQVAWLAYPGTTGSSAIGYRLTDPWLDPVGSSADDRYSEKSVRLPNTFWCYDSLTTEHEVGPLPADAAGHVTFGCLNNPCKLTDRTFELWARVMKRVEGSRLALLLADGEAREIVNAKFAAFGVDPARISYTEYRPRAQYLRAYQEIDIVLDTFPYNGHTTSLDALWMGVPVVTAIGNGPASRAGYSLLSNVGLPELAASSEEGFVDAAVALATDLPRLRALRADLRERMTASPLMDGERFARGMEQAFQDIWRDECRLSQKALM